MASGNKTNIQDMRDKTGLPETSPEQVQDDVMESLFANVWQGAKADNNEELMQKVEAGFEKHFKIKFDEDYMHEEGSNFGLFGPPGYGKTASVESAAKNVAELLGMNFVDVAGKPVEYIPGPNDFCYISVALGGQTSPMAITGLPMVGTDGEGEKFTTSAGAKMFNITRKAPASLVIFDDATNAHPKVLGALLEVLQKKRYGEHKMGRQSVVALTGNLEGDGSAEAVRRVGDAIHSRVKNSFVMDSKKRFVERYQESVANSPYSPQGKRLRLAFAGFVDRMPEDLFYENSPVHSGTKVNSRSLSMTAKEMPRLLKRFDIARDDSNMKLLEDSVKGLLGETGGKQVTSFYKGYLTGAIPIADEFLSATTDREFKAVREKLTHRMEENGGAERNDFVIRFAHALNSGIVVRIQEELKKGIENADMSKVAAYSSVFAKATQSMLRNEQSQALENMTGLMVKFAPSDFLQAMRANPREMILSSELYTTMRDGIHDGYGDNKNVISYAEINNTLSHGSSVNSDDLGLSL